MKLYLVQHGEAKPKQIDPNRSLTEKGKEDSIKIAEFLKRANMIPDVIWHSTKIRAMETAQLFSEKLSPKEGVVQKEGLSPNDPVKGVFHTILSLEKDVMIVGHLPFLQNIISFVLFGFEDCDIIAKIVQSGVICLEREEEGDWKIKFGIIPDLLK